MFPGPPRLPNEDKIADTLTHSLTDDNSSIISLPQEVDEIHIVEHWKPDKFGRRVRHDQFMKLKI